MKADFLRILAAREITPPRPTSEGPVEEGEEGEEMETTNPDDEAMMAMMGMSGFGSTKVRCSVVMHSSHATRFHYLANTDHGAVSGQKSRR